MNPTRHGDITGRAFEISWLLERLTGSQGLSRSLIVGGESGVGKTAVVETALAQVDAPIMRVTAPMGADRPLDGMLNNITMLERTADSDQLRASRDLVEEARRDLDSLDLNELARRLVRATQAGPRTSSTGVFVVDDAHLFDNATLQLMSFFARSVTALGYLHVFVIDTSSDRGFPSLGLDRIDVTGLRTDPTRTLLDRLCGFRTPLRVAEFVRAHTTGNPGLIHEMVARLGPESLSGSLPLAVPLPATRRVLQQSAIPVDPESRLLLACFALTPRIPRRVLERAASGLDAIDTLLAEGWIVDHDGTFAPKSALMSLRAWHGLTLDHRAELHRRFHPAWLSVDEVTANALHSMPGSANWWVEPTRVASEARRFDDAIRILERASSNAEGLDRVRVLTDLATTQLEAGYLTAVGRTLESAPDLPNGLRTVELRRGAIAGDQPWPFDPHLCDAILALSDRRPPDDWLAKANGINVDRLRALLVAPVDQEEFWQEAISRIRLLGALGDTAGAQAELWLMSASHQLGPLAQTFLILTRLELAIAEGDFAAARACLREGDRQFPNAEVWLHHAAMSRIIVESASIPESAYDPDHERLTERSCADDSRWLALGYHALIRADLHTAVGHYRSGLRAQHGLWPGTLSQIADLIEIDIALNQPIRARQDWLRFGPRAYAETGRNKALILRSQALMAAPADRDTAFAEALSACDDSVSDLIKARTLLAYGRRMIMDDRSTDATGTLDEARDLFGSHGLAGWVDHLDRLVPLGNDRAVMPTITPTADEHHLIELVAAGYTNRQIAQRLYVSVRTVENRLGRLYKNAGVSRRMDLIRLVDRGANTAEVAGALPGSQFLEAGAGR